MSDEWSEKDDLAARVEWSLQTGQAKIRGRGVWYTAQEIRALIADLETGLLRLETQERPDLGE